MDDDVQTPQPAKRQKKDPNTPRKWHAETPPFDAVRYYAPDDDVVDEEIETFLHENSIQALSDLQACMLMLGGLIQGRLGKELSDSINDALKRVKMTPTMMLGGELIFDTSCINKKSLDHYAPKAVAVSPSIDPKNARTRFPNFTLVFGPSGSGKTMFALQHLPELVFPGAVSEKSGLRVHLMASTLLGDEPENELDLSALLVNYVQRKVKGLLLSCDDTVPTIIDLFLLVTIDEAGSSNYEHFFDEAFKIENLVTALDEMKEYKFTKGVHVTVTGTGLETSTKRISANHPCIRFSMQPWSSSNFHAMLRKLEREDEDAVKELVQAFPTLKSLTSNARCANVLVDSLPTINPINNKRRWAGYVDVAVATVTQHYIDSNCLAFLSSVEMMSVAQEAFKAINNAIISSNSTTIDFPSFDHIKNKLIRSATQSLLDINVETKGGTYTLMGNIKFSVSMSPAITVVLAERLCGNAIVSWNWQGFETAAALGEWKILVTNMRATDFSNSRGGIIQMESPVLNAKIKFTLPLASRSTVLLNGHAAPYADVMAPFRLLQCKFLVDTRRPQELDLEAEMSKMGLSNNPAFRLNQAVTSVLYVMWQQSDGVDNDSDSDDDDETDISETDCDDENSRDDASDDDDRATGAYKRLGFYGKQTKCEHYPYQTLLTGLVANYERASFKLLDEKDCRTPAKVKGIDGSEAKKLIDKKILDVHPVGKEAVRLTKKKPIKILEEFTESQPMTAVFVTNAKSFVLKKENRVSVTIKRSAVDWQGVLKKPLPEYLVGGMRDNVEMRFLFY